MSELAEIEKPVPDHFLALIERAVSNPEVDIGKMQALLDMQLTIMDKEAERAYLADFPLMQAEIKSVRKEGKGQSNNYATFDDMNDATQEARAKYGFSISFVPETGEGFLKIKGIISHRQGHQETTELTLPFDTTGNKNDVQAIGSSLKYGMRYCMMALLSISTHEGDTDGALITYLTVGESESLNNYCIEHKLDAAKFYEFYSKHYKRPISSWEDFPAGSFNTVMDFLQEKAKP